MTAGFLLQMLVNDPTQMSRYSHLVLDEVHERSTESDMLLLIAKLVLKKCKTKLVLMSATLQVGLFGEYFESLEPGLVCVPEVGPGA